MPMTLNATSPMKAIRKLRTDRAAVSARLNDSLGKLRTMYGAATDRALTESEKAEEARLSAGRDNAKREIETIDEQILEAASAAEAERSADPMTAVTGAARLAADQDPNRGFRTPREFVAAVVDARGERGAAIDERLRPLEQRAAAGGDEQSGSSDSHGGFLVPRGFLPNMISVAAEMDPTAGLTRRIPMASPSVDIPARTDKDHSTSVSGGLRVYRRKETQTVTASRLQTELLNFKAESLMGIAYATEEIMTDSAISFAALIADGFRDEFGSKLIDEKIDGTGVGEYLGVLKAGCKIAVAKESGQAADTINGTNLAKMRARCWRYGSSIWIANHDTLPQLMAAHIAGTNGDVFLFAPGNGSDKPDTLFGRPVVFTDAAKTVGDEGDLVLGVWGEYGEGNVGGLEQAESMHVRFIENERALRFVQRNCGQPLWRVPLTPKNGAATLSPFVTLAVRA